MAEVAAYCRERGNNIEPAKFVAHYEANGWMRGKTRLVDWKAAVRYWETNERPGNNGHGKANGADASRRATAANWLQRQGAIE